MQVIIGAVIVTALFMGPIRTVTAEPKTPPQVRVFAPRFASRSATGSTFKVRWAGPQVFAPRVFKFHVAYRELNERSFKPLPSLGSEVTTATSALFTGEAGQTYIFRVGREDSSGRVGSFARARTIVPVDDDASRYKQYIGSWAASAGNRFYFQGEHQSRQAGAAFTYNFDGRKVWLIGAKGPDRGRAQIYLDGVSYGSIDLHASRRMPRQVLWSSPPLKPISSIKQHQLKVVVAGTTGRPLVGIDALARLK